MMLTDYDRVVCLCVDRRYREAVPRITEVFRDRLSVPISFFVNGDGRMLERRLYDRLWEDAPAGWTQGFGAWQHFVCMKDVVARAKEDGVRRLLWIEDDAYLVDGFDEKVGRAAATLRDSDWQLLYYGANSTNADLLPRGDGIYRTGGSLTTHLVGIDHSIFDDILALPPYHVIDRLIADRLHLARVCLAFCPSIALQLPGHSHLWGIRTDYTDLFLSEGRIHCSHSS